MQSAVRRVYQTRSRTTRDGQLPSLPSATCVDTPKGIFGIADVPKEILLRIARQLDLGSQLSFMLTNKYYNRELGPVDITGPPSIKDSSLDRDRAELFALEAIELMERLPPYLSSRVALLYEGGEESQVVAVDAQYNVRITKYTNLHYPDIEIDDPDFMEKALNTTQWHTAAHTDDWWLADDELLYEGNCDKAELLKILCNAPFEDSKNDIDPYEYSSQLQLLCTETGHLEEAAQYCYNLMCSRQWHKAVLYVLFKNSSDWFTCVVVETRGWGGNKWYVNGKVSPNDPVQPNFDAFPSSAIKVAFFCESEPCGDYWQTLEACLCTKSPSDEQGVVDQVKRFLWQEDLDWQIE